MLRTLIISALTLCTASIGTTAEVEFTKDLIQKNTKHVSIDTNEKQSDDSSSSLSFANTGYLQMGLSPDIHAGSVTFYTKENMHVIGDPKKYHTGPHFYVYDDKGRTLSMGILYAKYLAGDKTYTFSNFKRNESGGSPFSGIQYVGVQRKAGWNKWTFNVTEDRVASISLNDKKIDRINLEKVTFSGIQGIGIKADQKGGQHSLHVDNITYTLGKKLEPIKEPALTPDKDPQIEASISIVDSLKGKHPRLLFTAEDIPAIREMAKNEGKFFMDRVTAYVPSCRTPNHTKFLTNATDGQRQGLWRLPTVCMHWVVTEDPNSLAEAKNFLKFLIELEQWEQGREHDCGMSSANIMIGAALAYDILYHELDPAFREQARKKLLLMARRQYYHGHMGLAKSVQYWQGDPANNHRWHRNAGMVLATLAAADDVNGENDYQWILEMCKKDMDYVNKWLPADGTSHESPSYLVFGLTHLCLFTDAADRCLGTKYQEHSAFKYFPYFRIYTKAQGMKKTFAYGDSGEGAIGGYNHAFFFCTRAHQDKTAQAAIEAFMNKHPKSFDFGWFGLVWYDRALAGGDYKNLPHNKFFEDMGLSFMRDSWDLTDTSASMMLKCGPYGGYDLNKYRNQNNYKYVNIAHDDPDANEIIIFARGKVFAKPDGYSEKKKTHDHNTLIVNDKGQVGSKGGMWSQPPKGLDLTTLSYTTTYKDDNGKVICEGEAGNCYEDIDRFRRSVIWLPGAYILVIDDIRAQKENNLEIRWQGKEAEIRGDHAFALLEDGDALPFSTASLQTTSAKIIDSRAEAKSKILGYKQVVLESKTQNWSLATVVDAWNSKPTVAISENAQGLTVTVTNNGKTDTWTLQRATDQEKPSTISGVRDGKVIISCDESDLAPRAPQGH